LFPLALISARFPRGGFSDPYLIFEARLSMVGPERQPASDAHLKCAKPDGNTQMSIFDLSGRTAVITGGNGGIGLGIAQALASSGCNVSIWGRNAEKNKKAAAAMAGRSRNTTT